MEPVIIFSHEKYNSRKHNKIMNKYTKILTWLITLPLRVIGFMLLLLAAVIDLNDIALAGSSRKEIMDFASEIIWPFQKADKIGKPSSK